MSTQGRGRGRRSGVVKVVSESKGRARAPSWRFGLDCFRLIRGRHQLEQRRGQGSGMDNPLLKVDNLYSGFSRPNFEVRI